jgi:hypothetical protein
MFNPLAFITPINNILNPTIAPAPQKKVKIGEVAFVAHSLGYRVGVDTDLETRVGSFKGIPSAQYNRQGRNRYGEQLPPLKPIIEAQLRDPKIKAVAIMAFANQVDMPPEKFQDEIKDLTNLAKSNGKKLILITEPTKSDPGETGRGKPLGNMAKMNDIMRDFARDNPDNIALIDIHKFPESIYNRNYLHQGPAFSQKLAEQIEAVATTTSSTANDTNAVQINASTVSPTARNPLTLYLNGVKANIGVQYNPDSYERIRLQDGSILVKGPQGSLIASITDSKKITTSYVNPENVEKLLSDPENLNIPQTIFDRVWG